MSNVSEPDNPTGPQSGLARHVLELLRIELLANGVKIEKGRPDFGTFRVSGQHVAEYVIPLLPLRMIDEEIIESVVRNLAAVIIRGTGSDCAVRSFQLGVPGGVRWAEVVCCRDLTLSLRLLNHCDFSTSVEMTRFSVGWEPIPITEAVTA